MSRIVVSGIGLNTSLGPDVASNWKNLTERAIGPGLTTRRSAPSDRVQRSKLEGYSRALELAESAAREACADAALGPEVDPSRIGCTFSASKPLFDGDDVRPPESVQDRLCERLGFAGERRNIVAACATGAYAMALAASWIEQGLCDVVLAGSVEPWPHPLIEAGFRQMGVLSPDGDTRPFDAHRSGFHFGEGAGAVVLESEDHRRKRIGGDPKRRLSTEAAIQDCGERLFHRNTARRRSGSPPFGITAVRDHRRPIILSGWALGADGHSAVAFNSNGQNIASVIGRALRRASLEPSDIAHVNAHGTGTMLNDWIETQALLKAFGPHAPRLMVSATKASTGHLLGASGSVEFVFTVLALRHQYAPPTATLQTPDPACALDYTPREGHGARIDHALSLSFGFGGPIGALVASR